MQLIYVLCFTVHVYCGHVMPGIKQSRALWRDTFFDVKAELYSVNMHEVEHG